MLVGQCGDWVMVKIKLLWVVNGVYLKEWCQVVL